MPKKHEMTEHEYEIYRKIHDDDDPLAAEEGKISREKAGYARRRRRNEVRLRQELRHVTRPGDLEALDDDLDLDEEEDRAARELRNARTHKQRLKGLRKQVSRDVRRRPRDEQ